MPSICRPECPSWHLDFPCTCGSNYVAELQAELSAANARIAELEHDVSRQMAIANEHLNHAESLQAQLAAAQKDAERLRWCYGNSIKPLSDMQVHPSQYPTFEEWLVAIDAAQNEAAKS